MDSSIDKIDHTNDLKWPHRFIPEAGCQLAGKQLEIYMGDIRKAVPARWKRC
jgi:hypothetical protein